MPAREKASKEPVQDNPFSHKHLQHLSNLHVRSILSGCCLCDEYKKSSTRKLCAEWMRRYVFAVGFFRLPFFVDGGALSHFKHGLDVIHLDR